LCAGGTDFGVGFIDRAGDDYGVCIANMVFSVADEDGCALLLEAPCLFD
jgi:hypothetical protein